MGPKNLRSRDHVFSQLKKLQKDEMLKSSITLRLHLKKQCYEKIARLYTTDRPYFQKNDHYLHVVVSKF